MEGSPYHTVLPSAQARKIPSSVRMTSDRSAPMPPYGSDDPFPCRIFTLLSPVGSVCCQSLPCVGSRSSLRALTDLKTDSNFVTFFTRRDVG
jgi:hypothetical protein